VNKEAALTYKIILQSKKTHTENNKLPTKLEWKISKEDQQTITVSTSRNWESRPKKCGIMIV
jgi:hypothetical protein